MDIACLTKINLDLNKPEVKFRLIEKAKKLDKNIKIVMNASKTTTHGQVAKRGGVMTIVRGNWSSRICKSGGDKLGRWTFIEMQGKKGKKSGYTQYIESATSAISKGIVQFIYNRKMTWKSVEGHQRTREQHF